MAIPLTAKSAAQPAVDGSKSSDKTLNGISISGTRTKSLLILCPLSLVFPHPTNACPQADKRDTTSSDGRDPHIGCRTLSRKPDKSEAFRYHLPQPHYPNKCGKSAAQNSRRLNSGQPEKIRATRPVKQPIYDASSVENRAIQSAYQLPIASLWTGCERRTRNFKRPRTFTTW